MIRCLNCNEETKNPKFCSRSCAATYNGKKYPKRKVEGNCVDCLKPIKSSSKRCRDCNNNFKKQYTTLSDMPRKDAGKYSPIRMRSQTVYRNSGKEYKCNNCGYDKHVELCHIKAISSFPDDTLISEIIDINNLIVLCPNCHWEFDNGLLEINYSSVA